MAGKYVIAFDLGTSSMKVVIVDDDGRVVASDKKELHPVFPKVGWAESDPTAWWDAACDVLKSLIAYHDIDVDSIVGLSIDAPSAGFIPMSKEKGALYPSIIWLDGRSTEQAEYLNNTIESLTGENPGFTGKDNPAKCMWFMQNKPEIWAETDCFICDTSYLIYRATGEFACSKQNMFEWGYNWYTNEWDMGLLQIMGVDESKLPKVCEAVDIVGYVTEEAAKELGIKPGIPVVGGESDCSAAELGSGCVEPGDACCYVGTSMLFNYITEEDFGIRPELYTFPASNPEYNMLLATNDYAGGCIDWIVEKLFKIDDNPIVMERCYEEVDKLLDATAPGADGLFFTTSFQGERQPIFDNTYRAGFWNMNPDHGRGQMVRAVYEGICQQIRWSLERFCAYTKYDLGGHLRLSGGTGKSARFCQILADVTGLKIEVMEDPGFAVAKGTAFLSFIAAGVMTFHDVKDRMRVARTYEPRAEYKEVYDRQAHYYQEYYATTKEFFADLNKDA